MHFLPFHKFFLFLVFRVSVELLDEENRLQVLYGNLGGGFCGISFDMKHRFVGKKITGMTFNESSIVKMDYHLPLFHKDTSLVLPIAIVRGASILCSILSQYQARGVVDAINPQCQRLLAQAFGKKVNTALTEDHLVIEWGDDRERVRDYFKILVMDEGLGIPSEKMTRMGLKKQFFGSADFIQQMSRAYLDC